MHKIHIAHICILCTEQVRVLDYTNEMVVFLIQCTRQQKFAIQFIALDRVIHSNNKSYYNQLSEQTGQSIFRFQYCLFYFVLQMQNIANNSYTVQKSYWQGKKSDFKCKFRTFFYYPSALSHTSFESLCFKVSNELLQVYIHDQMNYTAVKTKKSQHLLENAVFHCKNICLC